MVAAVSLVPVPAMTRTRSREGGPAGRAGGEGACEAGRALPADEPPKRGLIDGAGGSEWCSERGEGAAKGGTDHDRGSFSQSRRGGGDGRWVVRRPRRGG